MAETVSVDVEHPERMIEMQTIIVNVNRMGKLYNNRRRLQMPPASLYGEMRRAVQT